MYVTYRGANQKLVSEIWLLISVILSLTIAIHMYALYMAADLGNLCNAKISTKQRI